MWEKDKLSFFDLYWDSKPKFESEDFKKALFSKGLEIETVEINCYEPPYLNQIEFKPHHFIGSLKAYWLGLDAAAWVRFPIIDVDANVFNSVRQLCLKYDLKGHEEQLTSLLRCGYFFYTLAEIINEKYDLVESYKELKSLLNLAISKSKLDSIKMYDTKGKPSVFKSEMVKSLITNSINETILKNVSQGWFNEIENGQFEKSELHIKYRNLLIFDLVCYLYREAKFIPLNKNNKVSITKEVGEFIAGLLEIGKIPLKASKKFEGDMESSSFDETLISSHFKMALKTFSNLDRFLYKGPFTDDEYDTIEDTNVLVGRILNDTLRKKLI